MSSRTIPYLIALSVITFTLALARATPASASTAGPGAAAQPADSNAVAAPSGNDGTTAPADSGAAAATTGSDSKETPEVKSKSNEGSSSKAQPKEANTKKSARKSKTKAAANAKGTVKKVDTKAAPGTMPVKPDVMPHHVQVQHILIGFTGSVPGKAISRSKEEAKKLAYEILDQARKGENFDELVRKYTDDSPPGIYGMSGTGVAPAQGEYARDSMVAAFGNVGFSISPGNIGIADYDPAASPFGWHIIKRLK